MLNQVVAAALLASVTLGAFAVLQDYGPESAIRRFHHAVQVGDVNELERVTGQDLKDPIVGDLASWVSRMNRAGAQYHVLRVERQPTQVYAALEYTLPNGETYPTVWIVQREQRPEATWKVNARLTYRVLIDNPVGAFR